MIKIEDVKELIKEKNGKHTNYFYNEVQKKYGDLAKANNIVMCDRCKKQIKKSIFNIVECKQKYNRFLCSPCIRFILIKEKYGVENVFQIKEIKNKIKEKRNHKEIGKKSKINMLNYWKNISDIEKEKRCKKISLSRTNFSKEKKENIEKKRKETLKNKYGTESIGLIYSEIRKKSNKKWGTKKYNEIIYHSANEFKFIKLCENFNIPIKNGPTLKYTLNNKDHLYYPDFELFDKYIIELKGSNHYYYEAKKSGEIEEKNKSAKIYCNNNNKQFFFLLDYNDYTYFLKELIKNEENTV